MQLVEVKQSEKDIYNRFVIENETGSFLQGYDWGSWQETLGRKILRYWILDIGGQRIGSLHLIKTSLPMGKYYLYCPYGPVIDVRFKIEDLRLLTQELERKFGEAVFIRIEPKNSFLLPTTNYQLLTKTKNIQPGRTLIIDLAKSEEDLLTEMHHKTRYNIRLAQKHGVEIKDEFHLVNGKGLLAKEAVELIAKTSQRQGFKAQNPDYFEKLISYFAIQNPQGDLKLHVYKALYNKQLLASAIIIDYGKTRTYLFGGSSDEHKNIMAPYLLHYRAMLDAKNLGLSNYDFWGIETSSGDTPGFVRFKLGFTTVESSIKQYAGAYDVIIRPAWYKVYKFLRWLNRLKK